MANTLDKDLIKEQIESEDILSFLSENDAEPVDNGSSIVCKTICHGGDSHKLYYYPEQRLFHCYTHCQDSFDIFELVMRVKNVDLNTAIFYVANKFNIQHKEDFIEDDTLLEDWRILKRWKENSEIIIKDDKIRLPEVDGSIIENYPQPRIAAWEREYITKEICDYMNVRYDPIGGNIIIPHYDLEGRLVGIRQRVLVKDNEVYGKYRPFSRGTQRFNHPLGWNLYGLDKAKDRINEVGIAMVFEAEKSCYQAMNYLGTKNNIAVSMCGSFLSNYQLHLLLDAGAKEICIGIDRDYKELYDEEYMKIVKRINKIYEKYSPYVKLSFMFDTKPLTGYKQSPTDCGKGVFLELWKNRIMVQLNET